MSQILKDGGPSSSRESWVEQTQGFAENWCEYRANAIGTHLGLLYPALLRALGPVKGLRVCDVGCGDGSFLRVLQEQNPARLTGIEINPFLVENARTQLMGNAEIYCGDISCAWPVEDSSADRILSCNVLMHLSADESSRFFSKAARVLAPEGRLVVCVVHLDWAMSKYSLERTGLDEYHRPPTESSVSITEYHRGWAGICLLAAPELQFEGSFPIMVEEVEGLEERYLSKVGKPLFNVLTFHRAVGS